VKHAQYFHRFPPYAIRHDITNFWHDQLACPGNAPRAAEGGLFSEAIYGLEDARDNLARGRRILSGDIGGFGVEICKCLA
jgi:hypothetical protein